jgi:hypothetical protein
MPMPYRISPVARATVSRTSALFNGQNPLGMSNAGAMKQLRGPKHETRRLARVRPARRCPAWELEEHGRNPFASRPLYIRARYPLRSVESSTQLLLVLIPGLVNAGIHRWIKQNGSLVSEEHLLGCSLQQ